MNLGVASFEVVAARRGRWTAILLLAALGTAWAGSLALVSAGGHGGAPAVSLAGHAMHPGHAGHGAGAPGLGALAAMWLAMMVAMMAPVELPAVAARLRRASGSGSASGAAAFLAGLVATWAAFAALAALAHWELERRVLVDARGVLASPAAGAALLAAIGLFQLTPAKRRCLAACRAAAAPRESRERGGALSAGLRHGFVSLGSCALLMLVPLAAGGMGLAPMAAVTGLLVVEKLGARGLLVGRAVGAALFVWGVALALAAIGA